MYRSFEISTLKREELLEIPKIALREVLLNMVVHRNYRMKGPSKIAIYDDRIEFFSPVQFVGPLNTENLLTGISYLRNPMICKAMREAGYIEKLGSGFIELFRSYEKQGLQKPIVLEGENYIKCILPKGLEKKKVKLSSELEDKLKQLFRMHMEINTGDVIQHLSVSRSTALRMLNKLIKENVVDRIGHKKSVRYHLKNKGN